MFLSEYFKFHLGASSKALVYDPDMVPPSAAVDKVISSIARSARCTYWTKYMDRAAVKEAKMIGETLGNTVFTTKFKLE